MYHTCFAVQVNGVVPFPGPEWELSMTSELGRYVHPCDRHFLHCPANGKFSPPVKMHPVPRQAASLSRQFTRSHKPSGWRTQIAHTC
jgi:hypothetical protein